MTAALVRISPLSLLAGPWPTVPPTIEFNGLRVHGADVGWTDGVFKVVDIALVGAQPTEYHTLNTQTPSLTGNVLTITRTWSPPTLAAVRVILKALLNDRATTEWIKCRGTKSTDIESANTNGVAAIDGAANITAALVAYNAVQWP